MPCDLHILGLDSSWACGDNDDAGKLWLTDEQVMRLATNAQGDPLEGFRLALVHHPFEELADGSEVRRLLSDRVDLVLRGHLHEPEAQAWADPERTLRQVVAGCLYENDRYPNACERIRIVLNDQGKPVRHEIRFRGWSPRGFWFDDNSLYSGTVDGRLTLWVVLETTGASVTAESLLGVLADRLRVSPTLAGLAERVRSRLLFPRSLLHIENVDSESLARVAASLIAELEGSAVLVSGRYQALGQAVGWVQVPVRPFDEATALAQLAEELGEEGRREEPAAYQRLVRAVGFLPLAVHLASGYLKAGHSAEGFLTRLHQSGLTLPSADVTEPILTRNESRMVIASAFALSLEALEIQLGSERERLVAGLSDLGFAPAVGFGASLGAAIAGLPPLDFEQLAVAAQRLSILEGIRPAERPDRAYRLHPLLAELLRARRGKEGGENARARMTEWFCLRLPELPAGQEDEQGNRWREIQAETGALISWLGEIQESEGIRFERKASWYAMVNGPFYAWQSFCEQLLIGPLEDDERSNVLWTLSMVAYRSGDLDRAASAARDNVDLDQARGEERGKALAVGVLADVLEARGDLDEALRIRREEELPVYERLGDVRSRAVAMGQIADVLQARGELDEALRIRREEQVPVYERLGDVRSRALAMGQIADVLQKRGELDEALRIRVEEQLPVYERLGASRDLLVCRTNLAVIYLQRGHDGDHETAISLLRLALEVAERMRLPKTEQIRSILREATKSNPISANASKS